MTLLTRSFTLPAFRQIWRDVEHSRPIEAILDDTLLSFTNTEETDTDYVISIPLPGFKRDGVTVQVADRDRTIEVTASKGAGKVEGNAAVKGSLVKRAISVPDDVDTSEISAKLEDGLLTITCPKVPTVKPRMVEVL